MITTLPGPWGRFGAKLAVLRTKGQPWQKTGAPRSHPSPVARLPLS
jgi:hypothetical protein